MYYENKYSLKKKNIVNLHDNAKIYFLYIINITKDRRDDDLKKKIMLQIKLSFKYVLKRLLYIN